VRYQHPVLFLKYKNSMSLMVSPTFMSFLELQNVAIFTNWVIADVISQVKMRLYWNRMCPGAE
jgi:hypothetical protein